jgi:replicative DNA helicase
MSLEAEQSVIGGLLQNNSMLDLINLIPENFEGLDNRIIFDAILDIKSQDLPYDCITVSEHLEKTRKLDYVGGLSYLSELQNNTPSSKNVPAYAKVVLRDYKSKALEQIGRQVSDIANEHGEFEPKLEKTLDLINSIQVEGDENLTNFNDALRSAMDELEFRCSIDGITGLSTSFDNLDKRMYGLQPGDFNIIAGRPAMGKTTLAVNMATAQILKGERIQFFSLEMPKERILDKMFSAVGGVPFQNIKEGNMSKNDWDGYTAAMGLFHDKDFIIDDAGGTTIKTIVLKAKKAHAIKKLSAIYVDYIQLVRVAGVVDPVREISEVSRCLKELSKELSIPIIALAQLNRDLEKRPDKRPYVSDLKGSGQLEQDCDNIMMVYRDEVYNPDSPLNKGYTEVITRKSRYGEMGMDLLGTELSKSRFVNLVGAYNYEAHTNNKGGSFNG